MLSIRPALEIINADLDREQGLVSSLKNNDSATISAKEDLNAKELEEKKNAKRRNCRNNYNMFEKEDKDSEVVKLFKETMKMVFLPARIIMGVQANYDWKPHKHVMTLFTISTLIITWGLIFYTHYMHTKNGDTMRNLEVVAVYGLALSCVMKCVNYLTHFKKILALFAFTLKICRQNSIGRNADVLKHQLQNWLKKLKVFRGCLILNLFLACIVPFVSFFVSNELVSLVPLRIPYMDESTITAFVTLNLYMGLNGVLAASGTLFCFSLYILLIFSFSTQVELIGEDFKQLDEMWANKTGSANYRRAFLRNICMRCQDMDNYIAEVKTVFDLKMFAYFTVAYFSQIICLFEIAKNNWIPGYAIATALFEEIMFYCYVGTKKTVANDRLCAIICDTNWYEYDVLSQKMLLSLLHSCQNASELQIGPIAYMNLTTGIEIIKSIYSYYTILTELL